MASPVTVRFPFPFVRRPLLDLSYNNLSGVVPLITTIILSKNGIKGSLLLSLTNCNALQVLDLGNNQMVSRFLRWLGNLKSMKVLILRSNQFYGILSNTGTNDKMNNSLFSMLKIFAIFQIFSMGLCLKAFSRT
jgi:Mg2+/citrate symporter